MGRSLKSVGNEGNPNKVGDFNQSVKIGSALALGSQTASGAVASHVMVLPDGAKAAYALNGYASVGSVTGVVTGVAGAPATTEVGVDVNGDLVFQATDAVTQAEVVYVTLEGDQVSASAVVASTTATLPGTSKARLILSATVDGNARTPVARGTAVPGAGTCAISDDGASVEFNVADAGLTAVISYIELPVQTVVDRLTGDVNF